MDVAMSRPGKVSFANCFPLVFEFVFFSFKVLFCKKLEAFVLNMHAVFSYSYL